MLPARILDHIEVKCTVLYPMAELEDLELILRRLVLLFCQICVNLLHVLSGMLCSHVVRDVCCLELLHHCAHARQLPHV